MSKHRHYLGYLDGRVHDTSGDSCWCGGRIDWNCAEFHPPFIHRMGNPVVEILPDGLICTDKGVVVRGDGCSVGRIT